MTPKKRTGRSNFRITRCFEIAILFSSAHQVKKEENSAKKKGNKKKSHKFC
jgi:hypothetical protein